MTRPTNTIRLAAAETIFVGVSFERIEIMGETIGYKATWDGAEYHDTRLTALCQRLWCLASNP